MSEDSILPLAAVLVAVSALTSWFVGRRLGRNWPRAVKMLIADLFAAAIASKRL